MPDLDIRSPAPWSAVLLLAPRRQPWSGAIMLQRTLSETASAHIDGDPVALVMFYPETASRVELCFRATPAAAPHMRRLVRILQLMAAPIAETGVEIIARTWPDNLRSRRLARLAGFAPVDEAQTVWRWDHERRGTGGVRRRGQEAGARGA